MFLRLTTWVLLSAVAVGCGSTKSRTATEQLVSSDAVDSAIAQIDFSPLAGQTVYFEREYIKRYDPNGFVNSDYVVSAIRQQIVSSGCLLQDRREDADFIIEGRIGMLGMNSHDIIYGLPANNLLNAAASVVPAPVVGATSLPTIPEISLAKKNDLVGAAKLGMFAYHRESKQRVWQSGTALARSRAKDTWILGAGPFQSGTVYEGLRFAGTKIGEDEEVDPWNQEKRANFQEATVFNPPAIFQQPTEIAAEAPEESDQKVIPASAEVETSTGG